jgi:signal transduction histidine kinase
MSSGLVDPLLLSNFVHQIINPLNGVIGTIDNLIDGTIKEPSRRQQRLIAVRAQLTHSIEMIRNLAFLAQVEPSADSGGPTLVEAAQDVLLPEVIIEAAQFFQEVGAQRGVKVTLTDPKTQYRVRGHVDLLRQVFVNLFDNAVKYSNPHTVVTVDIHPQKATGHLLVEVASEGCKLEISEKDRIFELGYRGNAARAVRASSRILPL